MSLDTQTKLGILFSVGGIIAGVLSGALSGSVAILSLFVLVFVFYLCYKIAPRVLKFEVSQVAGGWSGRTALKYFDLYFFFWLVFWVLAYTDFLRL